MVEDEAHRTIKKMIRVSSANVLADKAAWAVFRAFGGLSIIVEWEKLNQRDSEHLRSIKAALRAGSLTGAYQIGMVIRTCREQNKELPRILVDELKPSYHSKYLNLATNLSGKDLICAKKMKLSLRSALRLLPLFGLTKCPDLSESQRSRIRKAAKALIASFTKGNTA